MILLEDTRNQVSKHKMKNNWFAENDIEVRRTKLYVGDYTLPANQKICVDTKENIGEIVNNICGKSHERFRNELIRAQEAEIQLYILVENEDGINCLEDVKKWHNPRLDIYVRDTSNLLGYYQNGRPRFGKKRKYPTATKGITLFKAMYTMQEKYGARFIFCHPNEAGAKVIELLGDRYGEAVSD